MTVLKVMTIVGTRPEAIKLAPVIKKLEKYPDKFKSIVVATKVGRNPETIIDGQTGILISPKDSNALVRGLIKVLRDEKLAKRMGNTGREKVKEKFTIEKTIAQIEKLYDKLIHQKIES